jgi:ferrous iron transport protein B
MKIKNIALVGQPNSGKTSIFNILADIKTNAGGSTVDISTTEIDVLGNHCRLIDLPGTYSLNAVEPAEEITLDYLVKNDLDLIINVIDATLLTRGLELTVELLEYGKPLIIVLNMMDLAEKHGININHKELSKLLGVPIIIMNALYGKGASELINSIYQVFGIDSKLTKILYYTHHIEEHINNISKQINPQDYSINGSPRFYAIKAIEDPDILPAKLLNEISKIKKYADEDLYKHHKKDNFETVSLERHHLAMALSEKVFKFNKKNNRYLGDKIDTFLMHPVFGYGFLLVFFALYFFSIFIFGSLLSSVMEIPLSYLGELIAPLKNYNEFLWYSANGAFWGISGILGIVMPYFLPLVFLTSFFEETGYLSRIAFLIDGLFHKIGLHGKSVAPFILGFGCSIPALYATRMIENPRDRKVTGILIPFIPCSARIAVIFALSSGFTGSNGPIWSIIVFAWILLVIAVSGKVLSKVYTKPMGLVLEIPKLKLPNIKTTINRTWFKTKDFLKEAFIFLLIGSIVLSWIEYFHLAVYLDYALKPLISGLLNLPDKLSSTLVFGFFRKELIIVMMNQALGIPAFTPLPMTMGQIVVFIVFVSLYFPCFTTFVVIIKEFGKKIAFYSAIFSLIVAIVSAYFFTLLFKFLM